MIEAGSQQLEAKRQPVLAPDRGVTVEKDGVVLLRTQLVDRGGRAIALRGIGRGSQPLGFFQQGVESKRIGDGRLCRRLRGRFRGRGSIGAMRLPGKHEHQGPR